MISKLPNLETTVKLAVAALFTTVVIAAITVSGWMYTGVKANETEIETTKTEIEHILEGQNDIQIDIDNLIAHINTLNDNLAKFKLDTNSQISDNRLESTKSNLTTENNIEKIQIDVRFLQTNFMNLQNDIMNLQNDISPILNWVNQQQMSQKQ